MGNSSGTTPGGDRIPALPPVIAQPVRPRRECFPIPKIVGVCLANSQRKSRSERRTRAISRSGRHGRGDGVLGLPADVPRTPNIDAILMNPHTEPVPENAAAQYAVASALAHCASDSNFDESARISTACPRNFKCCAFAMHRCGNPPFATRRPSQNGPFRTTTSSPESGKRIWAMAKDLC
jgi:hypothetical protein